MSYPGTRFGLHRIRKTNLMENQKFIEFKDLLLESQKSKSTLRRKLAFLRKQNQKEYSANIKRRGKKIYYDRNFFLQYLDSSGTQAKDSKDEIDPGFMSKILFHHLRSQIKSESWLIRFETALSILQNYSFGVYSLESCCLSEGVPYITFYYWCQNSKEIKCLFKEAKKEFRKSKATKILEAAQFSLLRLIEGYEYIETVTTYEFFREA